MAAEVVDGRQRKPASSTQLYKVITDLALASLLDVDYHYLPQPSYPRTMSGLARDAAAFKTALSRQDYSSWHSQPPPLQPAGGDGKAEGPAEASTSSTSSVKKKKRPKSSAYLHLLSTSVILIHVLDIVYSQPADTGTGQNVNTQLVYAVNHLKSTGNPMRLQDLAIITSIPIDTDRALLEKFRSHDRVVHDPKTDLYSYRVRGVKGLSYPMQY